MDRGGVDGKHLVVAWRDDHRVDVELVDDIFRLVPPSYGKIIISVIYCDDSYG